TTANKECKLGTEKALEGTFEVKGGIVVKEAQQDVPGVTYNGGVLEFGKIPELTRSTEVYTLAINTLVNIETLNIKAIEGKESFHIVAGTDKCSKKGFLGSTECTVEVEFVPTGKEKFFVRLEVPFEIVANGLKSLLVLPLKGEGE